VFSCAQRTHTQDNYKPGLFTRRAAFSAQSWQRWGSNAPA